MKPLLLLYCLLLHAAVVFCQGSAANTINNTTPGSKTYAVVVGISKYANSGIPQLEFAHKDAMVFDDYLKSKAGGQVPEENIRLLLNENASYAAIYDALDWLLTVCKKDDLVYFYFSGHGDMENSTIYKLGFLLSYNTPRTNYINNAVRIEDVNNIANTLSVKVNAKVVLITDACHSGKLAGSDFRGTFLAGDQLRAVQNKEIRISSCAPEQLSAEDEGWGGGRGVFSFYLVNGLEGLADANNDKIISVSEIKNYLDSSLAADVLLARKAMKQSPVIKGNNVFTLAAVDEPALNALKKRNTGLLVSQGAPIPAGTLKPLPPQPQAWVFNLFANYPPEALLNFTALNKLAPAEIPQACLLMLADSVRTSKALHFNPVDTQSYNNHVELLETTLRENKDAVARFNNKLALTLSDRGQEIINKYLQGDAAELERLRYYNSWNSGYDVYPDMFTLAMKLTPPSNYLYQLLQVKLHYFSGVAARIKIPTVADPRALIALAMAEQQKAFALEENAAYIQNELGALYLLKTDYQEAEKRLKRATQIAPQWAMPHANLAAVYITQKKYDAATEEIKTAIALQPDLQVSYILNGFVKEKTNHLLLAEEQFWKSIRLNSRHYLPFERLGYVYMRTTQYQKADSMFFEADKRKKGFHFNHIRLPFAMPEMFEVLTPEIPCPVDSADVAKNDAMGLFSLGIIDYLHGNTSSAEKRFKQVVAADKSNPLAFHYLGKLLFEQKRWKEAAIIFNFAIEYYLDSAAFSNYTDSLGKRLPPTPSRNCIIQNFTKNRYNGIDDHYFAGRLYENWNHFAEAEAHYRLIIQLQPTAFSSYNLLWRMLEKIDRYEDAEAVLRDFVQHDNDALSPAKRELYAFYLRMVDRFPASGGWYYKAGTYYYSIAAADRKEYPFDKKRLLPDRDETQYQDERTPEMLAKLKNDHTAYWIPAFMEKVELAPKIVLPRTDGIQMLKAADSLLQQDDPAIAGINYKIGDLYVWQDIAQKGVPYYQKSLALQPNNANTRFQLIGIYDTTYQFTDAMVQLDSLYARREIDFDRQVMMAKYYIHENRFEEAEELLKDAQDVHPYKMPSILDLNGRLQLLAGKPKKALPFYKEWLAANPNDAQAMYTIARVYAMTGNITEAWIWLEKAMSKGFNYGWILKLDDVWDKYRKDARWVKLQAKFPAKQYKNLDS